MWKNLGATVLENDLEDYFSLWKAVIFFKKCTKCSVSTTVFLLRVAAEAEQKLPQYWTKVRQNKSVITETNSFFFLLSSLPFFSCPWEKLCWPSPGVSDHWRGGERESVNNSHPSALPTMPLNAAISSFGKIHQDSLPSALNCILSLQCTTHTHTPPISWLVDDEVLLLPISESFCPPCSLCQSQDSGILLLKLNLACSQRQCSGPV